MFWTNNYVSSPHIEALLSKEDVTLHELMDVEDILQECKSQNKKLIEYLTRPEVMEELVTLTTREPPEYLEHRRRYRYPNIACELLTCDVPTLNEKLAGDETLLAKLYSFIDTEQPLNPLLASFFSKIIGVLVARNSDQVLEFLKSRQRCVDLLLQHLETFAIMDLILKLVTQVEGSDMRQNILNWLDSQQLVQRLVKLLSPTSEPAKHANAAQLLCDMVIVSRENQHTPTQRTNPDPILNTLESGDTVSLLLETVLTGEKMESSIVGGIQVLLAFLGQKTYGIMNEGDFHGNGAGEEIIVDNEQRMKISNATIPYLGQLHKLLTDPPYKPAVRTTAGLLECPLGNTRLHVAKLLMALLSTQNLKIHEALADLGTFQTLLDLFFTYTWNNFLHTQVQHCLALAINCNYQDNNDIIYANIFVKCKLIDRILDAWDVNESTQGKENGIRQGYMGHLINIANNIVTQCEKCIFLDSFLKTNLSPECLRKWKSLVDTELAKINRTHKIRLGGTDQACVTNSDDNPDEYHSYTEGAYVQEVYSNYQGQQMTPQFIDNFGYHDDEFNDGHDAVHISVDQITTLAFTLSEEDLDKREDMFNKLCQQKQKAGLEECSGGAEWDEGELTFQTVVDKRDWPSKQQHHDSSSSEEDDEDQRDMHMEIDTSDPAWDSAEPLPTNSALPEVNPWDTTPAAPAESTGWANFDNFENTLNIESNVAVDIKPCDEASKETPEATANFSEKKTATGSNKPMESTGAGDAKVVDGPGGGASSEPNQAIVVDKSNDDGVTSTSLADKNANPNELLSNRNEESTKDSISSQEISKSSMANNEKASSDQTVACTSEDTPVEVALVSKDTK